MKNLERLDKIISSQGSLTRSEVKRLAKKGLILVDGVAIKNPATKISPEKSEISVGGKPLKYNKFIYLMMNKPAGVLSAARDASAPTVIDLLGDEHSRPGLFPAGRLDKDTTGLLIITNDGEYSHKIMSPKNKVLKTYQVLAAEPITAEDIQAFLDGISLADGTECLSASLKYAENLDKHIFYDDGIAEIERKIVEVGIAEGKYHQVKRMFAARKNHVEKLHRTSIGGLKLCDSLKFGEVKQLSFDEAAKALKK